MKIISFTQLIAWQKAHKLVLAIYKLIAKFPKLEKFALNDQMRRCAISITSNIAEGFSRQTNKEKVQFYFTAKDVHYLTKSDFDSLAQQTVEVHKLINGLIKSIKLYTKY